MAAFLFPLLHLGTLLLPSTPPMGFNTFDKYHFDQLNETIVLQLADSLQTQLLPSGYKYLVIDGGWTASKDANGTRFDHLDQYGRPIAAPERYPHGMKWLGEQVRKRGLLLGLWTIRGVHADAVKRKTPILGAPTFTADELVDERPIGGGPNGSCLWAKEWLGVNMSHPAAQAYYASRVQLLAEDYGADLIKADCMMCGPCYVDEVEAFTSAVRASPRDLLLSYSPGGGNSVDDGKWVAGAATKKPQSSPSLPTAAAAPLGSMYRVVTDFHGRWYGWGGLQQSLFIQGNFSAANLTGANHTFPDPDMLPLSDDWWGKSTEQDDRGQTIATVWMIARAPLMHAGVLPMNFQTLFYLTHVDALRIHREGRGAKPIRYNGNCTCTGGPTSCTIPKDFFPKQPCVAVWASALPGGDAAAATVNLGENETTIEVTLAEIVAAAAGGGTGSSPLISARYAVKEVWSGKDIGVMSAATGSFTTKLRAHASGCHKGGAGAVVLCSTGTAAKMNDDLHAVCGQPTPPPPNHTWPHRPFYVLKPADYAHYLQEDAQWAETLVPYVDLPDADLMTSYYYRWRVLKEHIQYTSDDGFVITEFLPYVPWSGTHNTIPAAAGHHIREARWLHDLTIASDYIRLWTSLKGDPYTYSSWIGDAAWQRLKLVGNTSAASSSTSAASSAVSSSAAFPSAAATIADDLAKIYYEKEKRYRRTTGLGVECFFQTDGSDAMEVSVSGSGCRPTMASIMWAEAMAAARFARLGGNLSLAKDLEQRAEATRKMLLTLHWNGNITSFATVPLKGTNNEGPSSSSSSPSSSPPSSSPPPPSKCDLKAVRVPDQPVSVRELLAFVPYYFEGLIPPDEHNDGEGSSSSSVLLPPPYSKQWRELFDDKGGFGSPWGLRTTERRHPCYNYSWDHGDCWNGPTWPYETARLLTGAANAFHAAVDAKATPPLSMEEYYALLLSYAKQHTRSKAANDTASPPGSGHVFENMHPDLGYWNNRQQMYWRGDPKRNMGNDYMHSTFCDLVLSGLIGIRPEVNGTVHVRPLVPSSSWRHFAVDHVLVHGKVLSVVWDQTGEHYRRSRMSKGLSVLVDGTVVAQRDTLGDLVIQI